MKIFRCLVLGFVVGTVNAMDFAWAMPIDESDFKQGFHVPSVPSGRPIDHLASVSWDSDSRPDATLRSVRSQPALGQPKTGTWERTARADGPALVPEPTSLVLLGAGLAGLWMWRARKDGVPPGDDAC